MSTFATEAVLTPGFRRGKSVSQFLLLFIHDIHFRPKQTAVVLWGTQCCQKDAGNSTLLCKMAFPQLCSLYVFQLLTSNAIILNSLLKVEDTAGRSYLGVVLNVAGFIMIGLRVAGMD